MDASAPRAKACRRTYDTADQCRIEADKIIQEKIAKGYTRSKAAQLRNPHRLPERAATVQRSAGADKEARRSNAPRLPGADRQQAQEDLLPFLQSVDRCALPALRKAIKAARKHYCEARMEVVAGYRTATNGAVVRNGTDEQCRIIELSGMAAAARTRAEVLLPHAVSQQFAS